MEQRANSSSSSSLLLMLLLQMKQMDYWKIRHDFVSINSSVDFVCVWKINSMVVLLMLLLLNYLVLLKDPTVWDRRLLMLNLSLESNDNEQQVEEMLVDLWEHHHPRFQPSTYCSNHLETKEKIAEKTFNDGSKRKKFRFYLFLPDQVEARFSLMEQIYIFLYKHHNDNHHDDEYSSNEMKMKSLCSTKIIKYRSDQQRNDVELTSDLLKFSFSLSLAVVRIKIGIQF